MLNKALLLTVITIGLAAAAASAGEMDGFIQYAPGGPISVSWDPTNGIYDATNLGSVDPVSGVVQASGTLYSRNAFLPGELDNPTGYTLIHPSAWWLNANLALYGWGFNGALPFEDYSSNPVYPINYIYRNPKPDSWREGGEGIPAGNDYGDGGGLDKTKKASATATASEAPALQVTPEPATMAFFCVTGIALLKRRSK